MQDFQSKHSVRTFPGYHTVAILKLQKSRKANATWFQNEEEAIKARMLALLMQKWPKKTKNKQMG
jgi:hypothetical protein